MTDIKQARMRDGSLYTGNQQFRGSGVMKSCCTCGKHRPSTDGWRLLPRGASCPECVAKHEARSAIKKAKSHNRTTPLNEWEKPGYTFSIGWPRGF